MLSNVSATQWPLSDDSAEEVCLRERHLYLRRAPAQSRMRLRSQTSFALRSFLQDEDFVEVDTPILVRSSPDAEGAREFIVGTRRDNEYFALAQSPQIFKQLLMASTVERYYQFARCFRDEDGRADRQLEFTQLDIEMSYVTAKDVINFTEQMLRYLDENVPSLKLNLPSGPIAKMSYQDAVCTYGTDKPDLRYDLRIHTLRQGSPRAVSHETTTTSNEVPHSMIIVKDLGKVSSKKRRHLQNEAFQDISSSQALRWVRVDNAEKWRHSLKLFCEMNGEDSFDEATEMALAAMECDDVMVLGRGDGIYEGLGRIRQRCAALLQQEELLSIQEHDHRWVWVVDFPLFQCDDDGKLCSVHHPFTNVANHDREKLLSYIHQTQTLSSDELLKLRSQAYDLVVDGYEIAGGSIRIHDFDVQKRLLDEILNVDSASFSSLLRALSHGCPPHGGIALGFDRLCAIFTSATSLREVIAFPKTAAGRDLLMQSPAPISHDYDTQSSVISSDNPNPKVPESVSFNDSTHT